MKTAQRTLDILRKGLKNGWVSPLTALSYLDPYDLECFETWQHADAPRRSAMVQSGLYIVAEHVNSLLTQTDVGAVLEYDGCQPPVLATHQFTPDSAFERIENMRRVHAYGNMTNKELQDGIAYVVANTVQAATQPVNYSPVAVPSNMRPSSGTIRITASPQPGPLRIQAQQTTQLSDRYYISIGQNSINLYYTDAGWTWSIRNHADTVTRLQGTAVDRTAALRDCLCALDQALGRGTITFDDILKGL